MKKLLSMMSVFALATGAATSAGFLSTTGNNQPTNVVSFKNNLSNLGVSSQMEESEYGHWRGTREEAAVKLDEIINTLNYWYPDLVEGKDYNIVYGFNGSWTLSSVEGSDLEFDDFSFTVIVDLNDLNQADPEQRTIDIDSWDATQENVEARIDELISSIAEGAKINVDYTIPIIYKFGLLDHVQTYEIKATDTSNILIGSFEINVTKTLDTSVYSTSGLENEGDAVLQSIIKDFKRWNPYAEEGVDYVLTIDPNGSWTINSTSDSLVKVDFAFNVVKDITIINGISFYINKADTTITDIEAAVAEAIDKIAEGAVEGVDYTIPAIPVDDAGRPIKAGRYLVKATPYSKIITGQFIIRLITRF